MTDLPTEPNVSAIGDAARPPVADRAAFQTELDRLRVREKAHTREGDAIAAARRRLPMVEVDPQTPLIGADGSVPLIDVFDGRSQLIAYFHMWHTGRPAAEQCEGCTFNTSHINELAYLHSRDVSYAVFSEGPYEESSRYRDFMGYTVPWYSVPQDSVDRLIADRYFGILACYLRDGDQVYETYWTSGRGNEAMAPSYGLLDRTVYGRQEFWEDSPEGWPQRWGSKGGQFRLDDGRPMAPVVADPVRPRRRPRPNAGWMDCVFLLTTHRTTGRGNEVMWPIGAGRRCLWTVRRGEADGLACRPGSVFRAPRGTRLATIHLRVPLPAPSSGLPAHSGGPPSYVRAPGTRRRRTS